jgi:hypothetical protein
MGALAPTVAAGPFTFAIDWDGTGTTVRHACTERRGRDGY